MMDLALNQKQIEEKTNSFGAKNLFTPADHQYCITSVLLEFLRLDQILCCRQVNQDKTVPKIIHKVFDSIYVWVNPAIRNIIICKSFIKTFNF